MKILTRFLTMKNEFYFVSFITTEFPVLLNPSLPGNISPICRRYFRGNEKIVHRIQYKNFRLFKTLLVREREDIQWWNVHYI